MTEPKLFISYNHSSFEFEEFVLRLATELRENGVDVVLDKWSLVKFEDTESFTKDNISDPDVKKIVIISDKLYTKKADNFSENDSQIITKELYESQNQEKFALIITEKNKKGKPFVPAFYSSKVFIDLSEPDFYAENFDRLIRWIFDKPLYIKPIIGEKPKWLEYDNGISLGTYSTYKKALEAVKNHRSTAEGRIDDYLSLFAENLERFRITNAEGEMDEAVYQNIELFKPFRDEFVQLLTAIASYQPYKDYVIRLHRFIEQMISYTKPAEHITEHRQYDLDNFMFIAHEIFLYTLAVLLKFERFDQAAFLLQEKFFVAGKSRFGQDEMIGFDKIHQHIDSLENLSQRLETGQIAPRADLLKKRSSGSGLDFRYLMQADFTAFIKAELVYYPYYSQWYPETLTFLDNFHGAFEIYARAKSKEYFDKLKPFLGIEFPADLSKLIYAYEEENRQLPRGLKRQTSTRLLGYKNLAVMQ
jgi:hypothetical protein